MRFTTDKWCSYVRISEATEEDKPFRTRQINNDVVADYSAKDGRLMGIEIFTHIPEKLEDKK